MSTSSDRVLVFDAAGTLIYPDPPAAKVYANVAAQHGVHVPEARIRRRFQRVLQGVAWGQGDDAAHRAIWREIVAQVLERPAEELEPLFVQLWDYFATAEAWAVFPDVREHWPRILARDAPVAIASNFDSRLRDILVGHNLWIEGHTFWSSHLRAAKPDQRFFRAIESAVGFPPTAALMVGDDRGNDYQAALDAGWSALLIDRKQRSGGGEIPTIRSFADL